MKYLILSAILLGPLLSQAENKVPVYKNWKTFKSDYGFEFKYPDCWIIKGDGPDEPDMAEPESKGIFITETDICKRPIMYSSVPNGIGISAGWESLKSKDEGIKRITIAEKGSNITVQRDDWKIYKSLKINGDGNAFIYVENNNNVTYKYIRWEMSLYCLTHVIRFEGPSIQNPDDALLKKFKAGDLALPEPEKTIYESIRCVESKKKAPVMKVKK